MRASLIILAISPLCLALPIQHNLRDLKSLLGGLAGGAAAGGAAGGAAAGGAAAGGAAAGGAAAGGILGKLKSAVANPGLNVARLKVVSGLAKTGVALKQVAAQAQATNNTGVSDLVTQAQSGLAAAKGGVAKIGAAIVTGQTPANADQATVAQGIEDADTAVSGMEAAITTPDSKLSSSITNAASGVTLLKSGGQGVLDAEGKDLADLGLNSTATAL